MLIKGSWEAIFRVTQDFYPDDFYLMKGGVRLLPLDSALAWPNFGRYTDVFMY